MKERLCVLEAVGLLLPVETHLLPKHCSTCAKHQLGTTWLFYSKVDMRMIVIEQINYYMCLKTCAWKTIIFIYNPFI